MENSAITAKCECDVDKGGMSGVSCGMCHLFLIWFYLSFTSIYCFLVSFTICTKEATFKCCCTNCVMTIEFDSRQRCRQGCNVLEQRENGDGEGRLAVCHFVPAGMELAFILGKEANARTAPLRPKQQQASAINSSEFQEALRLTDRADASHIMTLTRREFRVNSERLQFGPTLPSKGRKAEFVSASYSAAGRRSNRCRKVQVCICNIK